MKDFKVWRIIPLSMVTTCEEERDKWIAAGHEVVEFVSIDRIKQLEQELAEAKKESAMYWNKVIHLNEKLASFGLDEDFEDDAAIKESSK